MSLVPLDVPGGSFDVSLSGQASYNIPVVVPPGTGHQNEPRLSLAYNRGSGNGILGLDWSVGGLSIIQRSPKTIAIDGSTGPTTYDNAKGRFSLNGQQLVLKEGDYGTLSAQYCTEVTDGDLILPQGTGFVVKRRDGSFAEYGTTPDSTSLSADHIHIREWQLKKESDVYGNTVAYMYTSRPRSGNEELMPAHEEDYATYLDRIEYTSNISTGLEASRFVDFFYEQRQDPVRMTGLGEHIMFRYLLEKIVTSIELPNQKVVKVREYAMTYQYNPAVAATQVIAVEEKFSGTGSLPPTTFTYFNQNASTPWFIGDSETTVLPPANLASDTVLSVLPLGVTGKGSTDLVALRYSQAQQSLSLQTYLASVDRSKDHDVVSWKPSTSEYAVTMLPSIDLSVSGRQPIPLIADFDADGMPDIIVAYLAGNGNLSFGVCSNRRTGFAPYQAIGTSIPWTENARFFALDTNGNGKIDIVQITSEMGQLVFRIFVFNKSPETDKYEMTVEQEINPPSQLFSPSDIWFTADVDRSGTHDLIRLKSEPVDFDFQSSITVFVGDIGQGEVVTYRTGETLDLGKLNPRDQQNLHVLPCDINGDGIDDVVVCCIRPQTSDLTVLEFEFKVFLSDGAGKFIANDTTKFTCSDLDILDLSRASFQVADTNMSGIPDIIFTYFQHNGRLASLHATASYDGHIAHMEKTGFGGSQLNHPPKATAQQADLSGSGKPDFFTWSADKQGILTIASIFNNRTSSALLQSIQDPVGKKYEVAYKTLSNPEVYNVSDSHLAPLNASKIHGNAQLVVSAYTTRDLKSPNPRVSEQIIQRTYSDACMDLKGRGSLGFGTVSSLDSKGVELKWFLKQEFPYTGQIWKQETHGVERSAEDVVGANEVKTLMLRQSWTYEKTAVGTTSFTVWKSSEKAEYIESGIVAKTILQNFVYDSFNLISKHTQIQGKRISVTTAATPDTWELRQYTSTPYAQGLLSAKKITTTATNTSMSAFEEGDVSFETWDFNTQTSTITNYHIWSLEAGPHRTMTFTYDGHGNMLTKTDLTGLSVYEETEFDKKYATYNINFRQSGNDVVTDITSAFDPRFGVKIAECTANDALVFNECDELGRFASGAVNALPSESNHFITLNTDRLKELSLSGLLLNKLSNTQMVQTQIVTYKSTKLEDQNWFCITEKLIANSGNDDDSITAKSYFDCSSRAICTVTQQGSQSSFWKYFTRTGKGKITQESPAVYHDQTLSEYQKVIWRPNPKECKRTVFDALGRPSREFSPCPSESNMLACAKIVYEDGGDTMTRLLSCVPKDDESKEMQMGQSILSFGCVAGNTRLLSRRIDTGKATSFSYDKAGRASGIHAAQERQIEERKYDSVGNLVSLNDVYQNPASKANGIVLTYDALNRNTSTTDALQRKTTIEYDQRDRVVGKLLPDGRRIKYTYDSPTAGLGQLAGVMITEANSQNMQSRYSLEYDVRGNITKKTLELGTGENFTTSYEYGLQNQLIAKTFDNGTRVDITYDGARMAQSSISARTGSVWSVVAKFDKYHADGKVESWHLESSGDVEASMQASNTYTSVGLLQNRSFTAKHCATSKDYIYDNISRIRKITDRHANTETEYAYENARLSSVTEMGSTQQFVYDDEGNILKKGDLTLEYQQGIVRGKTGSQEACLVQYDDGGRMVRRTVGQDTFNYLYDGFNKISAYTHAASGQRTEIISDIQGKTLVRKFPDGSKTIQVSNDYEVSISAQGDKSHKYSLVGPEGVIATILSKDPDQHPTVTMLFTDHKGTVSHRVDGSGNLIEQLHYDAFGLLKSRTASTGSGENTFESRQLDVATGLLDFGARHYDPLIGRFTTPDDRWGGDVKTDNDATNRYCFENNDPVNLIDPSGHSWGVFWTALAIGAVLFVAAVAVVVLAPLAPVVGSVVAGALFGAAYNSFIFAYEHRNEQDSSSLWGAFGLSLLTGAVIGAATGALGGFLHVRYLAKLASVRNMAGITRFNPFQGAVNFFKTKFYVWAEYGLARATMTGVTSAALQAVNNGIELGIMKKEVDWKNVAVAFGFGFLAGAGAHFLDGQLHRIWKHGVILKAFRLQNKLRLKFEVRQISLAAFEKSQLGTGSLLTVWATLADATAMGAALIYDAVKHVGEEDENEDEGGGNQT